MGFFKFLYNFFFVDQVKGHMSHTKFFSVLGYMTMIFAFLWIVVTGGTVDNMLFMIFGAVVIGNRSLNKRLEQPTNK
jgi:hypothetical protein